MCSPLILHMMRTQYVEAISRPYSKLQMFRELQPVKSCGCLQVKLSNMMRVLGGEAVADPTALEAQIRSQMLERQQVPLGFWRPGSSVPTRESKDSHDRDDCVVREETKRTHGACYPNVQRHGCTG